MSEFTPPHPPPLPGSTERRSLLPGWALRLHRNRHVTVPLAVAPLMWAAGNILYAFRLAGTFAVAAVVLCVVFGFFAPHKWRGADGKPRMAEVWYADLSVLLGSTWLWLAAFLGPLRGMVTGWILGGTLLSGVIAWGIPWWHHKRPREKQGSKKIIAEWDAWWQYHCRDWDLAGSSVVDVLVKGVTETLVAQLWKGRQSVRQVEQAIHLIESALGGYVRHGMLRVRVNPQNPSQVLIVLRRENPLAEVTGWDASLVPETITRPAPIGTAESGGWITALLLINWFINGASRKGKSNELSAFLATLTGVPDARVWLIDRKGGRAARPWLPALDWVAVTIDEARLMLRAGAAEVEQRSLNAYDGHEQLRPTAEVPALFVVIDETHEVTSLTRGDTECASLLEPIASMGMGVCVYTIVLTQYGSLADSVRTEQTRMNLINRMCFGVAKPEHGAFTLSDWDKLNAARLENPGEFYWQQGPHSPSEPGRGPHMPHELVRQIAARNGAMPRRPLVLYASAHQDVYDTRWSRLPEAFRSIAPQYKAAVPLPHAPQEAPAMDIPQPGNGHVPPQHADAHARAQRIEDELAGIPDVPLSALRVPDEAPLRTEIGRQKQRFARALTDAPDEGITPKQLMTATGLSSSWVHNSLARLAERGAVIKIGRGAYRASEGADIGQALEAIRRGDAALLESSPA